MPANEVDDIIMLVPTKLPRNAVWHSDLNAWAHENTTLDLYARNLASFRNGDVVRKHREPWGASLLLHASDWVIHHKVLDEDEDELLYVILQRRPMLGRYCNNYFMVGPAFFEGWTDAATRQLCYDADERAEAREKALEAREAAEKDASLQCAAVSSV